MIQKFGEHIRGWFAGIVIAVIAIAFVGWGIQYYLEREGSHGLAVATVNGTDITEGEFQKAYQSAQRQQQQALKRSLTVQELDNLKLMTLNQLISQTILVHALKKMGFIINLDEVMAMLRQRPEFEQNGQFSPERFSQFLSMQGYTSPEPFLEKLGDNIIEQQLQSGLRDSAFSLPYESASVYDLWQQQRNFSFTLLPITQAIQKVSITTKQIADYYKAHKDQFTVPAEVQLHYVMLSRDALAKSMQVSDAEVKQYYETHKDNFKVPKSWKISRITTQNQKQMQAVLAQLKQAPTLTDVMKAKHPEWQMVTQTISEADASQPLINVLNGLKVGQVSKPLPTPAGPTIVELLATTPAHAQPLAKMAAQIKKMLLDAKLAPMIANQSSQLSSLTYTNPTTLEPAAKALGVTVQTSPWISAKGAKSGVFANVSVVKAAFSDDVFKSGNNSNPISLDNGTIMVLRVAQKKSKKEKPLADVQTEIEKTLKKQIAMRQVGLRAYTVQKQLSEGKPVASLTWQQRQHATRNEPTTDKVILATAFDTPVDQYKSVALDNGFALVHVTKVFPGDWARATKQQQQALTTNLAAFHGTVDFGTYVKALLKQAKVKIKDPKLASSWSI